MSYPTSTGTTIQAIDFNSIRSSMEDVLGPNSNGYGVTGFITRPVTSTRVDINANGWKKLIQELNRINLHQTNADILYQGTTLTNAVLQGQLISPNLHNFLYDKTLLLETNRYNVHPSQLAPIVTTNGVSDRNTDWTGTIKHIVQVSWRTPLQARYFFNLGGYLNITAGHFNDASGGNNDAWKSLIASIPNQTYTRADFVGAATKYYPVVNGESPYQNLQYYCIAIRRSDTTITFEIAFYDTIATPPPDIQPPNPSIIVLPQRYTWYVQAETEINPPPPPDPPITAPPTPFVLTQEYSIVPNELDSCTIGEGQTKTFSIYTTNVDNGTVLYWTLELGPYVTSSDFTVTSGSVTINSNFGSFSLGISNNSVTENSSLPRIFYVNLRSGSVNGPSLVDYRGACRIIDTTTVPPPPTSPPVIPTYSIDTYPSIVGPPAVFEGDSIQFQVTTTNVPNGTVLYWTTNGYNTAQDFTSASYGSVVIQSNTGLITRSVVLDGVLEPNDWFQIFLRLNSTAGAVVASSPNVYIVDGTLISTNLPGQGEYFDEHLNYSSITLQVDPDGTFYVYGLQGEAIYGNNWATPTLSNGGSQYWVKFILSENTGDNGSSSSASTGWLQLTTARSVSATASTQIGKGNIARRSTYNVRIATDSAGTSVVAEGVYTINATATANLFSLVDPLPSQRAFVESALGKVSVILSFSSNGTFDAYSENTVNGITTLLRTYGSPFNWGIPATANVGNKYWISTVVSGSSQFGGGSSEITGSSGAWVSLSSGYKIRVTSIPSPTSDRNTSVTYNIYIASDSGGNNIVASGTYTLAPTGLKPVVIGGGGSIHVGSYMPFYDKPVGDFVVGDRLLLLSDDRQGTKDGNIVSTRISTQKLITLVSKTGITLTCSDNTPLTLEDGSMINSTEAAGYKLPVQDDNGFRWEEIVEVRDAGQGQVATIYCLDQCYAAGDQSGRWIWTHNVGAEYEKK